MIKRKRRQEESPICRSKEGDTSKNADEKNHRFDVPERCPSKNAEEMTHQVGAPGRSPFENDDDSGTDQIKGKGI
jgi:hypothetical protein